jgi:hypothetical protein
VVKPSLSKGIYNKLIMEGLLNLTMKPNEDTRDLLNWITDRMVIIKEKL